MDGERYTSQIDAPVDFPPERVVSLVPSVTESLFELNLGPRLVAVTDHCIYPEEGVARLPRIGGTQALDIEQIVALAPDLVIANREENRDEDVEALRAAGIPVWVTFPRTVREAFNLLWNIMHVFDEPTMVERIRSAEWVADWLERMAAQRESPCRVFVPVSLQPLLAANADTFVHDLIRVCGGQNVFAGSDTRYPLVTLDEVAAAQPDVVLLPGEPSGFTTEHVALFGALDMPAARAGAVHLVEGTLLRWHGTRMARALQELPGLICVQEDVENENREPLD